MPTTTRHARCLLTILAAAIAGGPGATAVSAAVEGIRTPLTAPIALRGGVLLLPLDARRHGAGWPSTLEILLADGRTVEGPVGWITTDDSVRPRTWTSDRSGLLIRPIRPDDDTSIPGSGAAHLAVALPADADGVIRFGRQKLKPVWRDAPARLDPDGPVSGALERADGLNRPDPVSAFEYWRWVLLADRLGMTAPDPTGNDLECLVARHHADLWRIGLARVASRDAAVALGCRDLLTECCGDRQFEFACWEADPERVAELLSLLIDTGRSDRAVTSSARDWIDRSNPTLIWPEAEHGDEIRAAIVNRRDTAMSSRLSWHERDDAGPTIDLRPGSLTRVTLGRPSPAEPDATLTRNAPPPGPDVLRITTAGETINLVTNPGVVTARPPGVTVGPLRPPLTLTEVDRRHVDPVPNARSTICQVRRIGGRWEVFFQCGRPALGDGGSADVQLTSRLPDAIRGIESVVLLVGEEADAGGPAVSLVIPEHGPYIIARGRADTTLEVHRRSWHDRWLCRVVLPDAWLGQTPGAPDLFGFLRGHGDSPQVEQGPQTGAPWRLNPGRIAIELGEWGW